MTNGNGRGWRNRIVDFGTMRADQFQAHPRNWRTHPPQQRRALATSLNNVGWVGAVLVNRQTGHLLDGHERLWQALEQGDETPVPYIEVDVSEDEEHLILATLDPIGAMAETDAEMLAGLLAELGDVPEFDDADISALLAEIAEQAGVEVEREAVADPGPQIDRAEELRKLWQTERGQVWEILSASVPGRCHRLMCGDSTSAEDVARLMAGERAAMVFTSPPYNAGVSAKLRGNTSIDDNLYGDEYDDNQTQENYLQLLTGFTEQALSAAQYVFVNLQVLAGNKLAFIQYLARFANKFADVAIWDKGHAAPAAAQRVMDSRFEFVLVFSHEANRAIGTREFRGGVQNVYAGAPQRHNDYADMHAATFSVELPSHFIELFTNRGDMVLDSFNGTGTTLVACEQTGRVGRGLELSPAYVAVALQRLSDMGLVARRVGA